MTALSYQSIKRLCQTYKWWTFGLPEKYPDIAFLQHKIFKQIPMIEGYIPEKVISPSGMSYGASAASYDVRIAHDLELGPIGAPDCCGLAHTIERFCMPDNVIGFPFDKSSYARRFAFAMNTLFDPGFSGIQKDGNPRLALDPVTRKTNEDYYASAVIEMVNFGKHPILFKAGDPICQFAFFWLDKRTSRPYRGKYSGQQGTQETIYENNEGIGIDLSRQKDLNADFAIKETDYPDKDLREDAGGLMDRVQKANYETLCIGNTPYRGRKIYE